MCLFPLGLKKSKGEQAIYYCSQSSQNLLFIQAIHFMFFKSQFECLQKAIFLSLSLRWHIAERSSLKRKDLFWFLVSGHSEVAPLFLGGGGQNITVEWHCGAKLLTSWQPACIERQEGARDKIPFRTTPTVTYFLQIALPPKVSTSS
jgi:hypothetical protein